MPRRGDRQPMKYGPALEGRTVMKRRLVAEGRWPAFQMALDDLKAGGVSVEERWAELAMKFPPLPGTVIVKPRKKAGRSGKVRGAESKLADGPASPSVSAGLWEGKERPSHREMVEWVFEHLSFKVRDLRPADAPSGGAWALLCWAKSDPKNLQAFYDKIWGKTIPSRAALGREVPDAEEPQDMALAALIDRVEERVRGVEEQAGTAGADVGGGAGAPGGAEGQPPAGPAVQAAGVAPVFDAGGLPQAAAGHEEG